MFESTPEAGLSSIATSASHPTQYVPGVSQLPREGAGPRVGEDPPAVSRGPQTRVKFASMSGWVPCHPRLKCTLATNTLSETYREGSICRGLAPKGGEDV